MHSAALSTSHRQVYESGLYAEFPKQVQVAASCGVTTMRVAQTAFQDAFPAIPEYALATSLRVGSGAACINDGGRWHSCSLAPGLLELKAPGVARTYDINALTELLFVTFGAREGAALMRQLAGREVSDFGSLSDSIHNVPNEIPRLMRRIWDDSQCGAGASSLLQIDCHMVALIAALLREAGHLSRPSARPEQLNGAQLRRGLEMLNDQLVEGVRLADLAARVGLSEHHFIRAFRNTTGLPPHQFQLMLRVRKARLLLHESDLTVAAVAQACGFSSQSHLGIVFRRWVGMTPARWRALRG